MADTANNTVARNNLSKHVSIVHKDARFLSSDDIQGKADLVVFEVSQHHAAAS
jgi:tRNA1(Val) A37 N6-methylase TrmN6